MQGRRHPTPGVVLATGIYRSGGPAPDPHTALTSGAAATLKLAAVPATFPSHQGLIIAAKLRWPDRLDATALCLGAAAPDLAYPLTSWLQRESHTPIGVVTWAVPVAAMTAVVLRRWAAPGLFACLPQLGRLQLRAYGALSTRRPSWWQTIASAGLGAVSHVFIDAFTHRGRWGANLLGLNGTVLKVPGLGELSGAACSAVRRTQPWRHLLPRGADRDRVIGPRGTLVWRPGCRHCPRPPGSDATEVCLRVGHLRPGARIACSYWTHRFRGDLSHPNHGVAIGAARRGNRDSSVAEAGDQTVGEQRLTERARRTRTFGLSGADDPTVGQAVARNG